MLEPELQSQSRGDLSEVLCMNYFSTIGREIGELVAEKNAAYGDSFAKAAQFLELLYPNGIQVCQYPDMLTIVRVFDKLMRIATDRDALGEDPWRDVAGYAILAVANRKGCGDGK
jgi:hypothetical protein